MTSALTLEGMWKLAMLPARKAYIQLNLHLESLKAEAGCTLRQPSNKIVMQAAEIAARHPARLLPETASGGRLAWCLINAWHLVKASCGIY